MNYFCRMYIKKDNPIFFSKDKIKYSARRGMLELDIMLSPYLDNCYMAETVEDKKLFIKFLASEDSDLFDWLFKDVEAPDEYRNLIAKIVQAKKDYNETNLV